MRKDPFTSVVAWALLLLLALLVNDAQGSAVTISSDRVSVVEGSGDVGTFTLTRDGDVSASLDVTIQLSGTATLVDDFTTSTSEFLEGKTIVSFSPGATESTFIVTPVDDNVSEPFETVIFTVLDPQDGSYTVGAESTATLQIYSPPNVVSITANPTQVDENSAAEVIFTVQRTGDLTNEINVSLLLGGSASYGDDYVFSNPPAFDQGQFVFTIEALADQVSISIVIKDDSIPEEAETIIINVVPGSGYTFGEPFSATVTINDEDPFSLVTISPSFITVREDDSDAVLVIARTNNVDYAIEVTVSIGGSAVLDQDYQLNTWAAVDFFTVMLETGVSSVNVNLTPLDDGVSELDENVLFNLLATGNYGIAPSTSFVEVVIKDPLPVVEISADNTPIFEDPQDSTIIRVKRTGSDAYDTFVSVKLSGSATFSTDYTLGVDPVVSSTFTVTVPAGQSEGSFSLTPVMDSLSETTETVVFTIEDSNDYTTNAQSSVTVTIADPLPKVSISATKKSIVEGVTTSTFTFTRDGDIEQDLRFFFDVTGTATFSADYTFSDDYSDGRNNGLFGAGVSSFQFSISAVDDAISEPKETVTLTIVDGDDYDLGDVSSSTVTIYDSRSIPLISVAPSVGTIAEGGSASFIVTRSGPIDGTLDVSFNLQGTATFSMDYTSDNGVSAFPSTNTLTFPPGSGSVSVSVNANTDFLIESLESVIFTVLESDNYAINVSPATINIADVPPLPQVSVSVSTSSLSEDSLSSATFVFTRSVNPGPAFTLKFSLGGVAQLGSDYTVSFSNPVQGENTLSFAANQAEASFSVSTKSDTESEPSESLVVTIVDDPASYLAVSPKDATLDILDSPVPTVTISAQDNTITETSNSLGVFVVSRTGSAKEDLTVFVVFGGTATFNTDFTTFPEANEGPTKSPVFIAKGSNSVQFAIEVVPDSQPEGSETVVVSIDSDAAYTLGVSSVATITIEDPPLPIISIEVSPSTLAEDSGNNFAVTIHRDGDLSAPLTISLNLLGSATLDVDYTTSLANAVVGVNSVTFSAEFDSISLIFTPISDAIVENFEVISLEINSGNNYVFEATPRNKVDFTISDPGFVFPEVSIAVSPAQIPENSETPASFTITRTGSTDASLSVVFSVSGTATRSSDYSYSVESPVTIPAGSSSTSIDVTAIFDTISPESTETVIFSIVDNFAYTVGSSRSATLEIVNVPFPPTISITCNPTTLSESSGTSSTFTLTRNNDLTIPVTVKLDLKGTATINSDYLTNLPNAVAGTSNTITFEVGSSTATFTVTPLTDDVSPESSETVEVSIIADSAYSISAQSTATFTITNTPILSELTIASNVNTIAENSETSIIYTITRTRDTSASLSVLLGLSGTATLNADYSTSIVFTNGQGTLVIPAGSSSASVTVTPIYDGVFPEDTETVVISILQTSDYNLGSTTSKSVSITDVIPVNFPVVSITSTPPSLTENTGASATFVLSRTGSLNNPLTVTVDLSGAAVLNLDYSTSLLNIQAGENSFTFAAGVNEIRFSVTPFADTVSPEDNEDVVFAITQSGSYLVGSPSSATLTIVNSAPSALPILSITATPLILSEDSNRSFSFTITRAGGVTSSLLVVNLVVSGAATPLDDYTSSLSNIQKGANTITIPAGSTTVTFTITPVDDTISPESNENIVVSLAPSSAYNRGTRSSVSVTIVDHVLPLPVVTIATTATTLSENSGESATITISRSGLSNAKDLSVDIVISGSANLDTDYLCDLPDSSSGSNSVIIPAGSNVLTFRIIPLVDANSPERTETVEITLLENIKYTIANNPAVTITITDSPVDNTLPSVTIGVSPNFLAETTLSPAIFTITRTGDTGSSLVVNINLSGTASFGTDYTVTPPSLVNGANTVTISPGATTATFSVTAAPDNIAESSETVEVSIKSGSTYSVGAVSTAILTITNGDVDPNRSIVSLRTISQTSIAESTGSNFQFSIDRTVTTNTLTVQFTLSGTATINTDYTVSGASAVGGNRFSVTFAAGVSTAPVTILITNDAIEEKDETILVGIQSSSSYAIGAPSSTTFTIRNDDTNSTPPTVTFEVVYVTPGTPSFRFNITNTQGSTAFFSFTFVLSSNELTINTDFDLVPRSGVTSLTPIASNRRNTDSRFLVTVDLALGPGQGFVYVIDVNNKVPATATEKKPLTLTASVLGQESTTVKFFRTSVSSNAVSSAFNTPNSSGAGSSPSVVKASPMGPADSSASSIVPSSIVVFSIAAASIISCVL